MSPFRKRCVKAVLRDLELSKASVVLSKSHQSAHYKLQASDSLAYVTMLASSFPGLPAMRELAVLGP